MKIPLQASVKLVMLPVWRALVLTPMTVLAVNLASPFKQMELAPVQMAPTSMISLLHVILALLPVQIATHPPLPALLALRLLWAQ